MGVKAPSLIEENIFYFTDASNGVYQARKIQKESVPDIQVCPKNKFNVKFLK